MITRICFGIRDYKQPEIFEEISPKIRVLAPVCDDQKSSTFSYFTGRYILVIKEKKRSWLYLCFRLSSSSIQQYDRKSKLGCKCERRLPYAKISLDEVLSALKISIINISHLTDPQKQSHTSKSPSLLNTLLYLLDYWHTGWYLQLDLKRKRNFFQAVTV